jgi:hypothetical protein
MLALSVVGRGFKPQSGQTKDYAIGICCFSAKHTVLMRKSKDWLACNQDNGSECVNMSIHRLLFQWSSTIKMQTKGVGLVQSGLHHHLIENILFSPWYNWKIAELVLDNNHSITHSTVNPLFQYRHASLYSRPKSFTQYGLKRGIISPKIKINITQ